MSAADDRPPSPAHRWAWAEIDSSAIEHNAGLLAALASPAQLWAVVKADGYGHGAVLAARAALAGGAAALCVALVQEGVVLRDAGIDAPILVLSQQPLEQLAALLSAELTPVVYSERGVDELAAAASHHGPVPCPVHVKVDTGMHRVGVAPALLAALVESVEHHAELRLAGVMTHLAVADEPDRAGTSDQLAQFVAALASVDQLFAHGAGMVVHAANSAGLLAHPSARLDAVRAGIALYGIAPGPQLASQCARLRPAMSLHARVAHVQRVEVGASISYGWRYTFDRAATVATVPIGYADGVPRRLSATGGEVLIGGRRRPIVGVVTMDQLMVDCSDDTVTVGDEVVLIGRQGDEVVTADEWAERLGTIAYEIVCGIGARVPRVVVGAR